uniref:Putative product n=1 Tax=Xenopsylla cheopis TaxID=163159 RepID=A0A6M2E236_XENCH
MHLGGSSFSIFAVMCSGPGDFLVFSLFIIILISFGVTGFIIVIIVNSSSAIVLLGKLKMYARCSAKYSAFS